MYVHACAMHDNKGTEPSLCYYKDIKTLENISPNTIYNLLKFTLKVDNIIYVLY